MLFLLGTVYGTGAVICFGIGFALTMGFASSGDEELARVFAFSLLWPLAIPYLLIKGRFGRSREV